MIGQSVAHYKVTDRLGVGGMGEVYRAHDSKLHRDVALKVLPAALAHDPDYMARFAREARCSPRSTIRTSRRSTASRRARAPPRW